MAVWPAKTFTATLVSVADMNQISGELNLLKTSIANDGRINGEIQAFREDISTLTISSGTVSWNVSTANNGKLSLTANVTTLTVTGWTASKVVTATLRATQDATGSRTFAFPAGWKWAGGSAPTITATANKTDIFVLYSDDGGTTIFASVFTQNA